MPSDDLEDTIAQCADGTEKTELLREALTDRTKILRFDGTAEDGEPITWFVAYRGEYAWSACRATGEWTDEPTDSDVEDAIHISDDVDLIDRSATPEEVEL